ncbi:MAG: phosphate ABC transporter permease subunit PstC [Acidobacteriia bacterium]|nr:phosphate ABC transporter permease subunit PstC [Terriglobia bacterium]
MPAEARTQVIKSEDPASKPPSTANSSRDRSRFSMGDSLLADRAFQAVIIACVVALLAIVGLILYELTIASSLSVHKFGFRFLAKSIWDPVAEDFGALPFIYGTLVSSLLALLIAVPLSMGTALFITELCPRWLRSPLSLCVELLAAIPSVIYGLWGIFVLAPLMRVYVQPFLAKYMSWTGLFSGPKYGYGMLAAGVVLAVMVLPYITSVTREVITAVPTQQREAVLALGATPWEMLRLAVLRNARVGIFGAIILGLGRALGETMAVTMLIGNRPEIARSLFAPGYTLASVIANEFTEATSDMYLSALVEMALILFALTLIVNAIARLLVWSITRGMPARGLA